MQFPIGTKVRINQPDFVRLDVPPVLECLQPVDYSGYTGVVVDCSRGELVRCIRLDSPHWIITVEVKDLIQIKEQDNSVKEARIAAAWEALEDALNS